MKMEDCKNIPDTITANECRKYFQEAITSFEENMIDKNEFLELIIELTDRQVQTYEILEEGTRKHLDECIMNLWNTDNYNDVDGILSIVVNIGLVKTYNKVIESLKNIKQISDDILQEIQEFIAENEGDISNPYRFL